MDTNYRNSLDQCWSALYAGLGNCQDLGHKLKQKFAFLRDLKPLPSSVINFGCSVDHLAGYGIEPFALHWTLRADKVVVVDINESSINVLRRRVSELRKKYPQCFDERVDCFEYFVADMTKPEETSGLSPNYFELAYCSRVLLNIEHNCGLDGVRNAIEAMARVVRPHRWLVSHEAGGLEPYPIRYVKMFRAAGFDEPKTIRIPESVDVPNFEIEYAVYRKLA